MVTIALRDAQLVPREGAAAIQGEALEDLARQYLAAEAVVKRIARVIDEAALNAVLGGVELRMDDLDQAAETAAALQGAMGNHTVHVRSLVDQLTDKPLLRIDRSHHGNVKVSTIDADFAHGTDYGLLSAAAQTFRGLVGEGARIARGREDKRKDAPVTDFRAAMAWLMSEAENQVSRQRYKGLGEMNPAQLWETTMDPSVRRLLKVQIEDAIGADQIFTTLMGDEVEPRRNSIEMNALAAGTIDV